jgi:septal ring factor EnvC (AmiA/AmiB activator)
MPDDDDIIKQQIEDLQKRWNKASKAKAELSGELKAKKEELATVVQEIRDAGYDPKHISRERDQAREELKRIISKLDAELTEVETALSSFNQKEN